MTPIQLPDINIWGILPALIPGLAGMVIMCVGLFMKKRVLGASMIIAIAAVFLSVIANGGMPTEPKTYFSGLFVLDSFTWFFNLLILLATGLTIPVAGRYLHEEGLEQFEFFVLLLFSACGMMFMIAGGHLLMIFLGLETLSIAIYVLTGYLPRSAVSKEAALKYVILGGFSSAVFMYGVALIYGTVGSASLPAILQAFQAGKPGITGMAGMLLMLVGFGFKTAIVPFHMWTPDVYEGAPTPLTGYMSVAVKAAAFGAFIRVFLGALPSMYPAWSQVLWVISVATMILGNFAALRQTNIKRMLAYSSIAHAGYILIGMIAGNKMGTAGMLYYLLAYTFTNLGAFAVVALVGSKGEANTYLDDYRGLGRNHPIIAMTLSLFLFSLAGIPPTAGFVGKFMVFRAALEAGYVWLVVIAALTSAASVFYYFRVIMKMYMEEPVQMPQRLQFGPGALIVLLITACTVLYIGILPTTYINMSLQSVQLFH